MSYQGPRILQYSTTMGTGPFALQPTAPTGFQRFRDVFSSGVPTTVVMVDQSTGDWAELLVTYTYGTPDTLTTLAVISSSNGGSAVAFVAGQRLVIQCQPSYASKSIDKIKPPVLAASTSAVTVSSLTAGSTLDGVTLAATNRVALLGQTDTTGGIYVIQASGGPVRATDFSAGDTVFGAMVNVARGTLHGGEVFICESLSGSDIVGTSVLTWGSLQGQPGVNAYTTTTASFTQPAVNSTVSVSMVTTAWLTPKMELLINDGTHVSTYTVSSITNATTAVLKNDGTSINAAAGTTIGSGAAVVCSGVPGTNGAAAFTTTSASFAQPLVNSTVSVSVGSTAWLAPGQEVFVTDGTHSSYLNVASVTNATTVVLTNDGTSGNAVATTTFSSGAAVVAAGVAGQSGGVWHWGVGAPSNTIGANGDYYLETGGTGDVYTKASASWSIIASILGPTGAAGTAGTNGSTWWSGSGAPSSGTGVPGDYYLNTATADVYEKSGGTWSISLNINGPNGSAGTNGTNGTNGAAAYTTTTATFTQPAVSSTVSVNVLNTLWMAPGQELFVTDGTHSSYYSVSSITSSTTVVLTNDGTTGNASSGATFALSANVVASGKQGPTGATGSAGATGATGATGAAGANGANAFTTTTASFTQPAISSTVSVSVASTAWMAVGAEVFITDGTHSSYYSVYSITNSTTVVLTNDGTTGNASSGATMGTSANVIASGKQGPTGATGANGSTGSTGATGAAGANGANAFTTTTASFTQPAISSTVSVSVASTAWMAVGAEVYITDGTHSSYYSVYSITNSTTVVLTNDGTTGNASSGVTMGSSANVIASGKQGPTGATGATGSTGSTGATGAAGANGANAFTTTTASFTQPAISSTVSVSVASTAWMAAGAEVYITDGTHSSFYSISSITNSTTVVLTNDGTTGNASSGVTMGSSSNVIASGKQGPTGTTGPTGSAGSNGTNGVNAYTTTSASYTQPAINSTVSISVATTAWMASGQNVYVSDGVHFSYYQVSSITNSTTFVALNQGTVINATSGSTFASGAAVVAAGSGPGITVRSLAYASSVTPVGSDCMQVCNVGTLSGNITIANMSGTPQDGNQITFRLIQDTTGGRTITWGSSYAFGTDITASLIPTTASSKCEIKFIWNATDNTWRAVAIARGF